MWTSSLLARSNLWCRDEALIEGAARQFEKYKARQEACEKEENRTFPRILHFIWLGSALPAKYLSMIDTWKHHHPTWEVILWNDENTQTFQFINESHFKLAPNFGMKSDILRYEVLSRYGGVYVDIDYECIRSLDDVVIHCDFFVGFSHTEVVEINNGLIGCVPRHPIMQLLINDIAVQTTVQAVLKNDALADTIAMFMGGGMIQQPAASTPATSSACDTISQTGPGLLTRIIYQYLMNSHDECHTYNNPLKDKKNTKPDLSPALTSDMPSEDYSRMVLFPVDVFHPVPNTVRVSLEQKSNADELRNDTKARYITENTVAIHWWQCSWQKEV